MITTAAVPDRFPTTRRRAPALAVLLVAALVVPFAFAAVALRTTASHATYEGCAAIVGKCSARCAWFAKFSPPADRGAFFDRCVDACAYVPHSRRGHQGRTAAYKCPRP